MNVIFLPILLATVIIFVRFLLVNFTDVKFGSGYLDNTELIEELGRDRRQEKHLIEQLMEINKTKIKVNADIDDAKELLARAESIDDDTAMIHARRIIAKLEDQIEDLTRASTIICQERRRFSVDSY